MVIIRAGANTTRIDLKPTGAYPHATALMIHYVVTMPVWATNGDWL